MISIAPEGLGLLQTVSDCVGMGCVVIVTVCFFVWLGNQKTIKLVK